MCTGLTGARVPGRDVQTQIRGGLAQKATLHWKQEADGCIVGAGYRGKAGQLRAVTKGLERGGQRASGSHDRCLGAACEQMGQGGWV